MKLPHKQPADILIVDDDADDRYLLDYAIEQLTLDVTVLTIPDARDALTYLQTCQRPPSLLITDLNMPYLTGLELLNLIKQSTNHRMVPVVILTTSQADEDRERCYRAGANAYLVKPGRISELSGLLQSCIRVWLGSVRS
ncbi:response regulator [soil metagenome]